MDRVATYQAFLFYMVDPVSGRRFLDGIFRVGGDDARLQIPE